MSGLWLHHWFVRQFQNFKKKGIETNLEIYNSIRFLKPNTFSNLWNELWKASVILNAFLRSAHSNFEHIFPCLTKNLTFRPRLVDSSLSITHPHLLLPTNYAACDILFKIKVKLSLWFVTWQWSYFFKYFSRFRWLLTKNTCHARKYFYMLRCLHDIKRNRNVIGRVFVERLKDSRL